jgi:hypothetical protein
MESKAGAAQHHVQQGCLASSSSAAAAAIDAVYNVVALALQPFVGDEILACTRCKVS